MVQIISSFRVALHRYIFIYVCLEPFFNFESVQNLPILCFDVAALPALSEYSSELVVDSYSLLRHFGFMEGSVKLTGVLPSLKVAQLFLKFLYIISFSLSLAVLGERLFLHKLQLADMFRQGLILLVVFVLARRTA